MSLGKLKKRSTVCLIMFIQMLDTYVSFTLFGGVYNYISCGQTIIAPGTARGMKVDCLIL